MDRLPKDIRLLIFWHVWKLKIKECHEEMFKKKLEIVDYIMKYFKREVLENYNWKKAHLDFAYFIKYSLYAKMIDYSNYVGVIEEIHVFAEPDAIEEQWSIEMYHALEKIHQTKKWHDIPDIPRIEGVDNIFNY